MPSTLPSRLFRTLLLSACLVTWTLAQAPPEMIEKIVEEGERNSKVMETLDHLVNKIGPRLTGSERLTQACEWARDTFASYGLEAKLVQWGEIKVGFDRGVHQGFIYYSADGATKSDPVVFNTNAWTPGTNGLLRGPAVLVYDDDADAGAFKAKVKGAWIVTQSGAKLRGKDLTELCESEGALGVVSSGAGMLGADLLLTSGNHETNWEELPKLPRVNLLGAAYDALKSRLKAGEKVELGFDIQNRFKQGPIPVYNVIAELKGTEKPEEMVIVGGHIDSWDGATGTTDNGTGTATTIEAARILTKAGAKPKRTIRFMLWSGEEQGLLGSRAYIKDHPEELPRVSAVLVHDGGTNYVSGIGGTKEMIPFFETVFTPVKSLSKDMPFEVREVKGLPPFIGSDQDSYTAKGVPGFFWNQKGRANYTHTHHTQFDTYDAAIPEYQRHTSVIVAVGALGIANLPEMIPRPKDMVATGGGGARMARGGRRLGFTPKDDGSLEIGSFSEESLAKKAGMQVGDKITKVDGTAVGSLDELREALNGGGAAKKTITVSRGGKNVDVTVEFPPRANPESRPSGDSRPAR